MQVTLSTHSNSNVFALLSAVLVTVVAVVFASTTKRIFGLGLGVAVQNRKLAADAPGSFDMSARNSNRTPVYFVSHGGPNVMFETEHLAYTQLGKIGREITQTVKPKAVVVFSAHWQAGRNNIEVNTAEITDLIYDYYGFPDHYYKVKYPNVGSKELGNRVLGLLHDAGIDAKSTKRGLDHGVFAPFTCMFHPEDNPLGVPIVQVSLFGNEDPDKHYALGAALSPLRDEGALIIGSGMAVHNLRDMWMAMQPGQKLPYSESFDKTLKAAVVNASSGEERKKNLRQLVWDKNARKAHPTLEHLLPVHIASGVAGDDKAIQTFTFVEGSLSWAQYRFGDV